MKACEHFEGYEGLAKAIVVQACIDYLEAKANYDEERILEVTAFFKSKWYRELTDTNGEWLLKKLDDGYIALDESGNLELIKYLRRG